MFRITSGARKATICYLGLFNDASSTG